MGSVHLKGGMKASELFFDVLARAKEAHPEAFEGLRWPRSQRAFRDGYAETLLAFERRRLASPARAEIARTIFEASEASMVYGPDEGEAEGEGGIPLGEHLAQPAEALPTQTLKLTQRAGLVPELAFRGVHYRGAEVAELADLWLEQRWMTNSAHRGIRWSLAQAKEAGSAQLVGHKIVSLGGGAELSPTRAMLRAGADVLFIDARDPSPEILEDPRVSGTITYVPGGADLLTQPKEILATIERFAGDDPVHIGMYAYSGGAAKEWRLTASMNAIVRALPRDRVRSVVMLISPTTPGSVSAEDAEAAEARKRRPLARPLGLGRSPSSVGQSGDLPARVSHSIVGLQGSAYQAAQYIGKMMAAEVFAVYGLGSGEGSSGGGGRGLTLSAPVAPITKTASLSHPLFDAGFEGADVFDILVSEPQATRVMCALLAFHDLLNPEAPSRAAAASDAERVAAILGEQIHGGVYAQGYALQREINLAALVGLARRPALLPPALRMILGRK